MFKISTGGTGQAAHTSPPSIEVLRRRARYRLIGAAVLVLIGVIGLPLMFDAQPRPIPVDIAIEIPAKDGVAPLAAPQAPAGSNPVQPAANPATAPTGSVAVPAPSSPAAVNTPADTMASAVPASPSSSTAPASKTAQATPTAPVAQPTPQTATAPAAPPVAAPTAAAEAQRVVVQVGAFADAAKAQEVRTKLERAGLKTYAQVANTAQGKRIRVRLGPFDNRAEAERAAAKVKALGLPAALLTL